MWGEMCGRVGDSYKISLGCLSHIWVNNTVERFNIGLSWRVFSYVIVSTYCTPYVFVFFKSKAHYSA